MIQKFEKTVDLDEFTQYNRNITEMMTKLKEIPQNTAEFDHHWKKIVGTIRSNLKK
jgi:hypothetical protein